MLLSEKIADVVMFSIRRHLFTFLKAFTFGLLRFVINAKTAAHAARFDNP